MKTIANLSIALSLAFGATAAQSAAYMKFDGVKGESTTAAPEVRAPEAKPAALLLPAVQKVREAAPRSIPSAPAKVGYDLKVNKKI